MRTLWIVFLASGFFGTIPSVLAKEEVSENPRRSTVRNRYFNVLADDPASAQFAATTGEVLAERFLRIVPWGAAVQPVLVDLTPLSRYREDSLFLTRIYPSGQVQVTVLWSEGTARGTLERALAQGFLTNLAQSYSRGKPVVPLWLELAAQQLVRVRAVSAHRWALAEKVKQGEPMSLEAILAAERGFGEEEMLGANAFWFFRFLEEESKGRGQLRNFLIRLLRGGEPLEALESSFSGLFRSMEEAEVWWLVGLNEQIRGSGSPMWPAERSRERLLELARLTFVEEGRAVRIFADELWGYRGSETLLGELRYRRRVLEVERVFFHVFYHNAALSLGGLFQALLSGNETAYGEAWRGFQHDLRMADELFDETTGLLDDFQAEIESAKR